MLEPNELKHKKHYTTNDGREAICLGNVIVLYDVTVIDGEKVLQIQNTT